MVLFEIALLSMASDTVGVVIQPGPNCVGATGARRQ